MTTEQQATEVLKTIESEVSKVSPYVTREQVIDALSVVKMLIGDGESIPPKTFINLIVFVLMVKI